MTAPRQDRLTTGLDGAAALAASITRDLACYFDGVRAGMTGGQPTVPDGLTRNGLACWLDGFIEGSADIDVDRSECCRTCGGDGCPVCLPGVAA